MEIKVSAGNKIETTTFYPTYKEWKYLKAHPQLHLLRQLFILPIRNGN